MKEIFQDQREINVIKGKRILLIIGGGISAYKCLDLIRRLRERGAAVTPIMTDAAREFITPLSVESIAANKVFSELFHREDEHDIGHIRLARDCDLVVVAPATADLLAKMANGLANDLATTILLATNRPILVAPAMNPQMWNHHATRKNTETLKSNNVKFIGPELGEMAESGEYGLGRMSEPQNITNEIEAILSNKNLPLSKLKVIVTSGPTLEPIDPVRYLANRSSGKQGHAIAQEAANEGAKVILISGPVSLPDPHSVTTIHIETATEMLQAVKKNLPADIVIMSAAVSDWHIKNAKSKKIKKSNFDKTPTLSLTENPDILSYVGNLKKNRPKLVIGFAAESENLIKNAKSKLNTKNADWIVANIIDSSNIVFGNDKNKISIIQKSGTKTWPELSKTEVARRLIAKISKEIN